MRVTILGAGTAISVPGHSPAGIHVRIGREHVVLDAGAGTLQRLHQLGVTFLQWDRLFLTHFHPDHCLDLVSFLFAMRLPEPTRTKPLSVYGPRGLKTHHDLGRTDLEPARARARRHVEDRVATREVRAGNPIGVGVGKAQHRVLVDARGAAATEVQLRVA